METKQDIQCVPCTTIGQALTGDRLHELRRGLSDGWLVVDEHHLEKAYRFRNFAQALAFTNSVGNLAEQLGHHPTIQLSWGAVRISVWTHKINGLSESDFALAAHIDQL